MSRDIFWIGFLVLAMIVLFMVLPSQAADYYVSTAGSDNGPGTQAQPFATIQHACGQENASCVHLDGSTFHESPLVSLYMIREYEILHARPVMTIKGDYNGPNGMGGRYSTIIDGSLTMHFTLQCMGAGYLDGCISDLTVKSIFLYSNSPTSASDHITATVTRCEVINSSGVGIECNIDGYTVRTSCYIDQCHILSGVLDGIKIEGTWSSITNNDIEMNSGFGISVYGPSKDYFHYSAAKIAYNKIKNINKGGVLLNNTDYALENNEITADRYGLCITGNNYYPDLGGGSEGSVGNNTIMGNGEYDIYFPNGTTNLYAKFNHWDEATEAQMASGNQKKTNITRFYDIFDYWQPGMTPTGAVIWDSNFGRNDKLDPSKTSISLSNNSKVQPTSLGSIKAVYR